MIISMMGEDLPGKLQEPEDTELSADLQDLDDKITLAEEDIAALEAMRQSRGWQIFVEATRKKASGLMTNLVYESHAPTVTLMQGRAQAFLEISGGGSDTDRERDAAEQMIGSWQEYIDRLRAQMERQVENPTVAEDTPLPRPNPAYRRF